jgi:hypothetical protein
MYKEIEVKNIIISVFLTVFLAGCATQSAMPLGNDMMQIDVSAAPVYGRAGAQQMAFKQAAQATLDAGYDKFVVVGNNGWTEGVAAGGGYGSASWNQYGGSGSFGSGFSTFRKPEVKMVIKMFKYKQAGSAKAVDARAVLAKK